MRRYYYLHAEVGKRFNSKQIKSLDTSVTEDLLPKFFSKFHFKESSKAAKQSVEDRGSDACNR